MSIDNAQLQVLKHEAGFAERHSAGRLWITGEDALDLLNRLTTNKLDSVPSGHALTTVLTNGDARVIDVLKLGAVDDGIWCITSPGRAHVVTQWLDLYTFGEDISVEDLSSETTHVVVVGPKAGTTLTAAGLDRPEPDSVTSDGGTVVIAQQFGTYQAYDVLCRTDRRELVVPELERQAIEADPEVLNAYRIAQGVPAYGTEFGEFNNPLEPRLLGAISDDKGCYTGQEVIARLQTYRKIQRLLMNFAGDGALYVGQELLGQDGSVAGSITSVYQADSGPSTGLALITSKHAITGHTLRVRETEVQVSLSHPAHALATEPTEH